MAAMGGGESRWSHIHSLPQESQIPHTNKVNQLRYSLLENQHRNSKAFKIPSRLINTRGLIDKTKLSIKKCNFSLDDEDSISHLEWETVRVRFLKAGTLERLVESLSSDSGELESTYINVFLNTYRTFASGKQVLNLLTER